VYVDWDYYCVESCSEMSAISVEYNGVTTCACDSSIYGNPASHIFVEYERIYYSESGFYGYTAYAKCMTKDECL